jgi:predicted secreted protein
MQQLEARMSISFVIAVYFIIWWIVLFAVLPFGVHTQGEAGSVVPGTPESAPAEFRLLRVVLWTTIVSVVVFVILWALVRWRIIDLEGLAGATL